MRRNQLRRGAGATCCHLYIIETPLAIVIRPSASVWSPSSLQTSKGFKTFKDSIIMILILPTTLLSLLSSYTLIASAQSCSQSNNKITPGNLQLSTDCSPTQFCDSNGQCQPRGCRNQEFPFGFGKEQQSLPTLCSKSQFCPDEGDACQDLLAVGSPCQLNRDGMSIFHGIHASFSFVLARSMCPS